MPRSKGRKTKKKTAAAKKKRLNKMISQQQVAEKQRKVEFEEAKQSFMEFYKKEHGFDQEE